MSDGAPEVPPAVDRRIDLDAARKARREKQGPAPTIVFLEKERELPRGLPAEVLELAGATASGDWTAAIPAVRLLLGAERYDEIVEEAKAASDPLELEDVVFLLEKVLEAYGVTAGES